MSGRLSAAIPTLTPWSDSKVFPPVIEIAVNNEVVAKTLEAVPFSQMIMGWRKAANDALGRLSYMICHLDVYVSQRSETSIGPTFFSNLLTLFFFSNRQPDDVVKI